MNLKGLFIAAIWLGVSTAASAMCPYDPNCLSNPYGAGNPFKPDGLMNPYSQYGSPYSNKSWTNPYATDAPKLYDRYSNPYSPDSPNNPYGAGNPYSGKKLYVVPSR